MTGFVTIAQSVYASIAHRYWNAEWSPAKNLQVYGEDTSREGIGSNLQIEVAVRANVAVNEAILNAPLQNLKSMVDHQCLFLPSGPFESRSSTLENITVFLAENLFAERPVAGEWAHLTIWESDHLACVVYPDENEVRLRFKLHNLILEVVGLVDPESGLALARESVRQAVHKVLVKLNAINDSDLERWSEKLFSEFKNSIPGLTSLQIDLGRHERVVVQS